MFTIRRNLVANYLGQGWVALMGLAFLPIYIRYLGMEAYGLIGLFAVVQAWLTLLDMGMTPTLNREMARFTAGAHSAQSIRDLLLSLEIICVSIAALITGGLWACSDWLANDWLNTNQLPTTVVAQAISVMAFVVALRFVEGIYRGSLFGLQQQVWYNGASAILATIRQAGAVAILAWVSPTIQAFFIWQGFFSLLTVAVLTQRVHRVLPNAPQPPKFSRKALMGVWNFAGGMMGITFLAILLTQVDKVLLSHLLSLESFGYYTLAATVAGVLYMVIGPITQALYPRMVELFTLEDQTELASVYHQGAQLVTVLDAFELLCRGSGFHVVRQCRACRKYGLHSLRIGAGDLSKRFDVHALSAPDCPRLDQSCYQDKRGGRHLSHSGHLLGCPSLWGRGGCMDLGDPECWLCPDLDPVHASANPPEGEVALVFYRCSVARRRGDRGQPYGASASADKLSGSMALVHIFAADRTPGTSIVGRTGGPHPPPPVGDHGKPLPGPILVRRACL
jgi:hypothetical protein